MEAEAKEPQLDHLVVVCSDAFALDDAIAVVAQLPKDFPAPVILTFTRDERRVPPSRAIRAGDVQLPVVIVEKHAELEAGKIFLVTSDGDVTIGLNTIDLKPGRGDEQGAMERCLSSAATAFGDRLVAVLVAPRTGAIVSGAIEVKRRHGVAILYEPPQHRSRVSTLPIPPTVVDHESTLEQIAGVLNELVREHETPLESDGALSAVLTEVGRQATIDFSSYKQGTILRRIARRMAVTHCADTATYARYLAEHPEEVGELVMAFLIRVTEFFRDPEAYAFLKGAVLPQLLEAARGRDRTLRVWSVGCATGEEPYSIALLIADVLGDELPDWTIKIFATDVDEQSIEFARRGHYPPNVIENVPWDYRNKYFEALGEGYRISKRLRQLVIFGQQDLSRAAPFPRIDLIVCRNVLIYFKPELQQEVLDTFAYSLARHVGYLFLGKAETARPSKSRFDLLNKKWKMYRCTQGPAVAPSRQLTTGGSHLSEPRLRRRDEPSSRPHELEFLPDLQQLRRFNESVLRNLPIGVVLMDRGYRMISLNAAARRILSIHEPIHEQDFLHSARGIPYADVRSAIDTVLRERVQVALDEVTLESAASRDMRFVTLSFAPMLAENPPADLVMITIEDVTEEVQAKKRMEQAQLEHRKLMEQIETANKRLSELNEELQATNEELQGANEEMTLAQEELQATNEEFEATNEELQATNEELETNNEELEATNEELEATNDELVARGQELQELTRLLETERTRLTEMIELAPFYIIVLRGPSLVVEAFNPRFTALFGERLAAGRALNDVFPDAFMTELVNAAHEAYRIDHTRGLDAVLGGGNDEVVTLRCSIIPTHDHASKVDGLVIYGVDVSDEKQLEVRERRAFLKLMVEHADQVALGLYDASSRRLIQASPLYASIEHQIFTMDGETAELLKSAIRDNAPKRLPEVRRRFTDEELDRVFDFTLTPISKSEGSTHADFVVVSAFEITEQVRAREQLERQDRMKDDFLALASHELRTPLVPLSGYAEMLSMLVAKKNGDGGMNEMASIIAKFSKQLRYLERMISDIVDVSRFDSGKMTLERRPLEVHDVVHQAIETAQMSAGAHKISLEPEPKPLFVLGDESRLVQAVGNLLNNALKYATDSQSIHVRVTKAAHDGAADYRGSALIEVIDQGPGIDARETDAIFTRFYQVRKKSHLSRSGMGLGLFIARALVEQHNGSITVVSEPGKGSNFQIRLPLTLPPDTNLRDPRAPDGR